MNDPQARLIESLVDDLTPTRVVRGVGFRTLGWWAISTAMVASALAATGALRPGADDALLGVPRFAFETALGLATAAALGWAALRRGIPALPRRRAVEIFAAVLVVGWVGLQILALFDPSLDPSMLGKRPGCETDVLIFGLPPLLLALFVLRGLAPFERAWAGGMLGVAAGLLPGVGMQLFCMYLPAHGLVHHVAPIAGLGLVGALLGLRMLRRI